MTSKDCCCYPKTTRLCSAVWIMGWLVASAFTSPAQERPATRASGLDSAKVNALTVSKMRRGFLAGHVSAMTLTAAPQATPGAEPGIVVENGNGRTLRASLQAVMEYFSSQNRWQTSKEFILSFEDSPHFHEGESFSLGVALLYDALETGVPLDDRVCVSGKLTSDGAVERVGGIAGKINAAGDAGFSTVIVPAANVSVFEDMIVVNRQSALSRFQIIGVDSFDQAREVATSAKTAEVETALKLYARLANLISKEGATADGLVETLNRKPVAKAIAQILEAVPQHVSAHYLSMIAEGKGPATLSPRGSVYTIDRLWPTILGAEAEGSSQTEMRQAALAELDRVTPLLDATSAKYVAAVRRYADLLTGPAGENESAESRRDSLREAATDIDTERGYLLQKLHRRQ
ncbi:MAG: hypothetical protein KDN22_22700 [Verrucomicrobiae bacterium]|nr:hypothetical protein [Verrucomicrobiae bacterium]